MPEFKIDTSIISANATKASTMKRVVNMQSYELSRISSRMIGVSLLPVRIFLQLKASELRREGRRLTTLSTSMNQCVTLYKTAENHIKEFQGELQNPAFTNGEYGGDQASPRENWKEVRDIVKKYHPDWSDRKIKKFLDTLNSEGCGYVALVNTIFLKYKGRADEFEKTFGYPMYKKNGELNYDALITELYLEKDDPKRSGTTCDDLETMWEDYCRAHGVGVDVRNVDVTASNYKDLVKDGQINVLLKPTTLYDENGKVVFNVKDAGHWMTVTGVTDDGRLIVSSWGDTYYLDKNLSNYSDFIRFQQVTYE